MRRGTGRWVAWFKQCLLALYSATASPLHNPPHPPILYISNHLCRLRRKKKWDGSERVRQKRRECFCSHSVIPERPSSGKLCRAKLLFLLSVLSANVQRTLCMCAHTSVRFGFSLISLSADLHYCQLTLFSYLACSLTHAHCMFQEMCIKTHWIIISMRPLNFTYQIINSQIHVFMNTSEQSCGPCSRGQRCLGSYLF